MRPNENSKFFEREVNDAESRPSSVRKGESAVQPSAESTADQRRVEEPAVSIEHHNRHPKIDKRKASVP